MLVLLSPAKSLDFGKTSIRKSTTPVFREETAEIAGIMKKATPARLKKLMGISENLAELNHERWQEFDPDPNGKGKQAILSFKGDVYLGLEAETLSSDDLQFAQKHIRILSGLYGMLKPLDLIQPYRLEMGTKLKTSRGKNLYSFWGKKITEQLNRELQEMKSNAVVNLASNEYFSAIDTMILKGDLHAVKFLEKRNGKYTFIQFTGKKARGWMSRFIIDQRISTPEKMKDFHAEGFAFNEKLSSEKEYVFTRDGQ